MKKKYLYIFFFLFVIHSLFAQSIHEKEFISDKHVLDEIEGYRLAEDENTHTTYSAREDVVFLPGFIFKGINGNNLTARLNELILKDQKYHEQVNNPDEPGYSDSRELNRSLSVGTVYGEVNVDPKGTATYTIPIQLPAGPSGLVPELSIIFNSGGGNSVLGHSFNLGGMSRISLAPKDYYHDNISRGMSRSNETYSLDGQRLLTKNGIDYVLEQKDHRAITKTNPSFSNFYFVVHDSISDMRIEYGGDMHSRGRIFWNINKVTDKFGNTINYHYKKKPYYPEANVYTTVDYRSKINVLSHEEMIEKITYGKNQENEIIFIYSLRDDFFHNRLSSFPSPDTGISVLLDKIIIKTSGTLAAEYGFSYMKNSMGLSCLTEISRKNSAGEQLNPTLFRWNQPNPVSFDALEYKPLPFKLPEYQKDTVFTGDFKGKGKTDILVKLNRSYVLYSFNDNNDFAKDSIYNQPEGEFISVGDFDGDGRTELLFYKTDKYILYNINELNLFHEKISINTRLPKPQKATSDINNNGKTEIPVREDSEWENILSLYEFDIRSNEAGFYPVARIDLKKSDKKEDIIHIRTGDFNADGFNDIIINGHINGTGRGIDNELLQFDLNFNEYYILDSKGFYVDDYGAFDINNDGVVEKLSHKAVKCEYRTLIRDINGDGDFTDSFTVKYVLRMDNYSNFTLDRIISIDGNSFFDYSHYDINYVKGLLDPNNATLEKIEEFSGYSKMTFSKVITEYRVDGEYTCNKSNDLFFRNIMDYERSYIVDINGDGNKEFLSMSKNDGDVYVLQAAPYTGEEMDICFLGLYNPIVGDFDGDGATDFICGKEFYSIPDPKTTSVAAIIDGNNNKIEFTYDRINDTNGTTTVYPFFNLSGPFEVISSITKKIGEEEFITNYRYSDSRYHANGRGFLGFLSFIEEDEFSRITTIREYDEQFVLPVKTVVRNSDLNDENFYTETETNVRMIASTYGNYKRCVVERQTTVSKDTDGNITQTTINYNTQKGYVSNQITDKKRENTTIQTEKTFYSNHTSKGLPQTIIKQYERPGDNIPVITQTANYTYNEDGLVETSTENGLKTRFAYDDYGNILSQNTGEGNNARVETCSYSANKINPERITDAIGQSTSKIYDIFNNIKEEFDVRNNKTSHTYNGWNERIRIESPDNNAFTFFTGWADANSPAGAFTYQAVYKNDLLQEKEYYNKLGQNIRTVSVGYNGMLFYTDREYDRRGNITSESEPYPANSRPGLFTSYEYDDLGRLIKETDINGLSRIYSYSPNQIEVKIQKDNITEIFTKRYDASGFMVEATDNGGTIEYIPAADNKVSKIRSPGVGDLKRITEIDYDSYRRRDKLTDPDAGVTKYEYDTYGNLVKETNANGNITITTYDKLNRVLTETRGSLIYTYVYDNVTNSKSRGLLKSITSNSTDGEAELFEYDNAGLGRLVSKTRKDNSKSLKMQYQYDGKGRLSRKTYPGNFAINFEYTVYDDLKVIRNNADNSVIWQLNNVNSWGQPEKITRGYGSMAKVTTFSYDTKHRLNRIYTPSVIDFNYVFNDRQQLTSRTERHFNGSYMNGFTEVFTYDDLDRLLTASVGGTEKMRMTYNSDAFSSNNQISAKTGIGSDFLYNKPVDGVPVINSKLQSFDISNTSYEPKEHIITYTNRLKTSQITEKVSQNASKTLNIWYGIDNQRFKQVYTDENGNKSTIWYMDDYEETVLPGNVSRKLSYISAGGDLIAINVQSNDTHNGINYIYTDFLGSVRSITNAAGTVKNNLSYDAWGNRRDPFTGNILSGIPDNLITKRGYTLHEHLDAFGYINMNGRLYDPAISMFLSPDPYIQAPDFTQNFNRYTYCLNNPFKYTDPDGEFAWFIPVIIGAVVGAYTGASIQSGTAAFWDWKSDAWKGAIAGAFVGAAAGGLFSAAIGATGMTAVAANGVNIASQAWGVTSSIINSASINIAMNAISGGGWDSAYKAGLVGALTGAWGATGGFGMVKAWGAENAFAQLSGKLAYQMIGTTGHSIGNNWAKGEDPFSKITLGVGPVNFTLGKDQKLLQWQNNLGNIVTNALGLGNLAFKGKVQFNWKNLAPVYTGGLMEYMGGAWGPYSVMGPSGFTQDNLQHEMHHIWQSRAFGDTFLLHYGLQGINGALIGRNFWHSIWGYNYFEGQAYGHFWFNP